MQRVDARSLILHVGIHKTASTYIQHRLKGNQPFLRQQRLLYPKRRCDHLELVKALRQGDLAPWEQLLHKAQRQGCRPLVSAEILSLVLPEPGNGGGGSLLADLLQLLNRSGMGLELVAFVRDQPTYLNSRYTQLLKRFYLAIPFPRYVMQTMRTGGESNCDYLELFAEVLDRPEVRCRFLPFRAGEADPCERLLQAVGVTDLDGLRPLSEEANVQPGWQAVWIAQRIARRMAEHHPQAWSNSSCKARIREQLEQLAAAQGWPAEPFQGLNEPLLARIERRYGASNDRFARRVWGCDWRELFPRPTPRPSPVRPRSPEERRRMLALADQLLAAGLQEAPLVDQA
jgi:hypothetical protein